MAGLKSTSRLQNWLKLFDDYIESWLEIEEIPTELWTCYKKRHSTTCWRLDQQNQQPTGKTKPQDQRRNTLFEERGRQLNLYVHESQTKLRGKKRRKTFLKLHEHTAVSYTHLDVYKRQTIYA